MEAARREIKRLERRLAEVEEERTRALTDAQALETTLAAAQSAVRESLSAFSRQQADVEAQKKAIYAALTESDRAEHKLETLALRLSELDSRADRNRRERTEAGERVVALGSERSRYVEALGGLRAVKHFTMESDSLRRPDEIVGVAAGDDQQLAGGIAGIVAHGHGGRMNAG